MNWVETDSCPWDMVAGFRALILLRAEDVEFVRQLSPEVWSRWAALPLARPLALQLRGECSELLVIAYGKAPATVLQALYRLIKRENERQGIDFVLEASEPLWDAVIEGEWVAALARYDLKPSSFGAILGALLRHEATDAVELAKSQLENIPASGAQRERALLVARAMIRELPDAGWTILWPIAQRHADFIVDALAGVSGIFEARQGVLGNKLSDNQLADLYIWLTTRLPYREEADEADGFGAVSPSRSLAWFRDSLLEQLKRRSTSGSTEALSRVARNFPQYSFLLWHLTEAEQIARAASWTPISVKQLFALTSNPDKRLVQSGSQLLQVLLESLQRLEVEMHAETPTVFALWDEHSGRPKSEGRLSDFVKVHFERDLRARGIVVNREVEIRKGTGPTRGEETDIHVDAVVAGQQGKYDRISVIIETKGCWNKELKRAIETQLVDRYLKENTCPFGLYLVGWFVCAQWDATDYRKEDTPKITLDEARDYFAARARELSSNGRLVESFVANCALR